ncbi:MAG: hypothetical protein DRO11_03950, partial [Methanobacteriota archaeon]
MYCMDMFSGVVVINQTSKPQPSRGATKMHIPTNKTILLTLLVVAVVATSLLTIATKQTQKNLEKQAQIEETKTFMENIREASTRIENQTKNLSRDNEKLLDNLM